LDETGAAGPGAAALVAFLAVSLAGCATGPFKLLPYVFVDERMPAPGPSRVSQKANGAAATVDVSTLEPDVRALAAPELQGRLRGTEGNTRARAHIVASLKSAGLAPLFGDDFEQPAYPDGRDAGPYAVNVGALYRARQDAARWIVLVAHYDHRGVIRGQVQAGADDNASAVALLLAIGHALGRARPALRRHVVLLFPDAEEPPDVRTLLRLYRAIDSTGRVPWLLRRALEADRRRVERTLASWEQGVRPTAESYREIQLASIRVQAALWHPSGWWFALW
jgi:Peptidase family M28